MAKAKIIANFKSAGDENKAIFDSINNKFSDTIIEYPSVPRIGEWVDLLEFSGNYNLSAEESQWLSAKEHKYRIENVNMREGYIEAVLDTDRIWQVEA